MASSYKDWCVSSLYSFVSTCNYIINELITDEDEELAENSNWDSNIPLHLLEEISDRLPLRDFVTFRSVCRHWRSAPSGRSTITNFSRDKRRPWFMFYRFDETNDINCYLYNTPHPNCCIFPLPQLHGTTILMSKSGWLFARRRDHFFLFNPFTLQQFDLPKHKACEDQVCTMTTVPTSPGCTVLILSGTNNLTYEVSLCYIGDTEWRKKNHLVVLRRDVTVTECRLVSVHLLDSSLEHILETCGLHDQLYFGTAIGSEEEMTHGHADDQSELVEYWGESLDNLFHRKDWLDRFGKDDSVSISTCYHCYQSKTIRELDGILPLTRVIVGDVTFPFTRVFRGDPKSPAKLASVKSTWIEPRLGLG